MAERPPKTDTPYRLDPGFEKAVVFMCATRPRFWGRIGYALEPECLGAPEAKLIVETIRPMAKESGSGPDRALLVLQRLRRRMDDGRVTQEQIVAAGDYLDAAEDAGVPREDDVVNELAPVLKRRLKTEAVRVAMEDYAKDSNFQRTTKILAEANRLGDADTSVGIKLGVGSFDAIESVKHMERLPLGIVELDWGLDGGLRRGGLGIVMAASGGGKSMTLSHIGARSVAHRLFAAYATLEVSIPDVLARIKANLCDVPINAILDNPETVRAQLAAMQLGPFYVQEFTPQVTTFETIEAWVEELEQVEGRSVDVLITDYGDKLAAPKSAGKDAENGYSSGRIVFERMRVWAHDRKKFHWTAVQATRGKDKRKRLDLDDTADSMHKIRVADLVVTINPEDDDLIKWFVAKHRHGKSKFDVGPLPSDLSVGRVAPVSNT
jgi:DnaB-like helicase C terminal domain